MLLDTLLVYAERRVAGGVLLGGSGGQETGRYPIRETGDETSDRREVSPIPKVSDRYQENQSLQTI
jgi:hypothetical protein